MQGQDRFVTKEIVMEMHELILKGNDEKVLSRELKSKITKGKIKVVSDLDETRHALNFSERERASKKHNRKHVTCFTQTRPRPSGILLFSARMHES